MTDPGLNEVRRRLLEAVDRIERDHEAAKAGLKDYWDEREGEVVKFFNAELKSLREEVEELRRVFNGWAVHMQQVEKQLRKR